MSWRDGRVVMVAILVVLGGLAGPTIATAVAVPTTAAEPAADHGSGPATNHTPPDPDTDVIGWEDGIWHNESIAVNQSDGLNTSERNVSVARAMARVELIRQLEFERSVPVELQSREAYQAQRRNETVAPALRTFDNVKFEALFLIGENEDSIEVQDQNAGVAVLGFYSPRRKAIVLISENASTLQVDELTLAHELVHALQDQHFNLSRYNARTRDGANAESGLIEGDASFVEFRYRQRCQGGMWNGTCLAPPSDGNNSGGELANIGTYLVKFQPYSDGPNFINGLYSTGGWAAVNEAYDRPPTSSEQVIHPEKYTVEEPRNVTLEDRQTDSWQRVRPPNRPDYGTVGEAALTSMLVFPLYDSNGQTRIISPEQWLNQSDDGQLSRFDPLNYANRFASGWDGDRLHVYVNGANETAYVWRLVWDSEQDAGEFLDGYEQVLRYWGADEVRPGLWVIADGGFADSFHVTVDGDTVTIVNAPSVEQLTEVHQGIDTTPRPTDTQTPETVETATVSTPTMSPEAPVTTTPGQPGFGPVTVVAAILAAWLWRSRR